MKTVTIINGPNLNLLGTRETNIYGDQSFDNYLHFIRKEFNAIEIFYYQSNIEGELVDKIQEASNHSEGIIINPGGYAHTSVAIRDAISAVNCPVVEVHISNLYKREEFRQQCITAGVCEGIISGFGLRGYQSALEYLLSRQCQ